MTLTVPSRLPGACGVLAAGGVLAGRGLLGLELAALALLPPFLAYLCWLLRPAREEHAWLATAALVSGVLGVGLKFVSIVPHIAIRATGDGTPLTHALEQSANFSVILSLYPLAIFSFLVALLALTSKTLPRWLGVLAGATGMALAINAAFLESDFVPGYLLFIVWVLLAGADRMLRGGVAPVAAA